MKPIVIGFLTLFLTFTTAAETRLSLSTSLGDIELLLDDERAPITVANFVSYVKAAYYDGTLFHRVIPGFMIQGGGFEPGMKQKTTQPPIQNEAKNGLQNRRGTLAMARTGQPHSATSQFFINLVDNPFLDQQDSRWGYAVFGSVVSGMEVVDAIAAVSTGRVGPFSDVPRTPVLINSIRIQ